MVGITVKHVAWLRFNEGVTEARIGEHLAACRGLPAAVPALLALECGPNQSDRAGGFTHGIIATLATMESMPAYLEHPEHLKVVTPLQEDVADLRVMDIQVDDL
ncbi:MAG: Dabb family protein [Actinobacteria bacterium]|nr:Dabb family protein [Actinomycetota bacterium]